MLAQFIQLIFFLCIYTPLPAMNKKQKNIVRAKLYAKYDIAEIPQSTRTIIQPLDDLKFHRSTIKANHIKELYNANQYEQALESYKTITNQTPYDLSTLNPNNKKAYESIHNTVTQNALNGSTKEQLLLTERYIQKLSPLLDTPDYLEAIKFQNCVHAYELLNFTATLKNHNVPLITTDYNKKELIKLRDIVDPVTSYLIQSTLYLQSINKTQQDIRYSMLLDKKCPENPEVEMICQFLLNYGDNSLSDEKTAQQFIKTIISHKPTPHILSAIAESPFLEHIIQKLSNITLNQQDPLLPHLYYFLAELHYKNNNYTQANSYYQKNKPHFLKEKKVQFNAFNAYLATTETFCKQDISYLSSLVGNIYNQLKKLDKTNSNISYGTGTLIQALIENNTPVDPQEKTTIIFTGLEHLTYAQKMGNISDIKQLHIPKICSSLHRSLALIYNDKNDLIKSLNHSKEALLYNSFIDNNPTTTKIVTILNQAEKNNPDLYTQYAACTKLMLDCIEGKQNNLNQQKNYTLLTEYASSDLCTQLLPYCEAIYKKNKRTDTDINYIMALNQINKNNYNKANQYIDALTESIPYPVLLLKAQIYIATEKRLQESEITSLLKSFINHKKTSPEAGNIVLSLITQYKHFFIQANNHTLAVKIISKLSELNNTPHQAIQLASFITNNFIKTNNPYYKQWKQELNSCQFYNNIAAPDNYDSDTNIGIVLLLLQNETTPNYEKIISHAVTAVDSKELSLEKTQIAQKNIAMLYYNWAETKTDDKELCLQLLNKAIEYDNNAKVRYKKATIILESSNDPNLINQALQLLEQNSTQDCPEKTNSQIALAQAYFNYSPIAGQLSILQQCIPLDIEKGISYLKDHNQAKEILKDLVNIFAGESPYIPQQLAEKYQDLNKAVEYINLLINSEPNNIDYISIRFQLYDQLKQRDNAINDIDYMLNTSDLSNTRGVTQEILLLKKIELLLSNTINDTLYDQIIACFKQLNNCNEKSVINLISLYHIQKHTDYIITKEFMNNKDIEWCYYIAQSIIAASITDPMPFSTPQAQEQFTFYLFTAAEKGNIDIQLTLLPYLSAMKLTDPSSEYFTLSLDYAHKALSNKQATRNQKDTIKTIMELEKLTKEGLSLPYYILCDYYKNCPKKLEQTMLLFNKAALQKYYFDDPTGTTTEATQNIYASCKNTLQTYVTRYIKNPKQGSLLDAVATFTLGSMYLLTDENDILSANICYIERAIETLFDKYSLTQYLLPSYHLLGKAYYRKAFKPAPLDYKGTPIHFGYLCKSAKYGYLPSIHELAQRYIQYIKDDVKDRPFNPDDFVHLLVKSRENEQSSLLLTEYLRLTQTITSKDVTNLVNRVNKKTSSMQERTGLINEFCKKKNLIKYTNYTESNKIYKNALQYKQEGNATKSAELLLEAAHNNNHPIAYMILALSYLTGELTAVDYNISEQLLKKALAYGLINISSKNKKKQFCYTAFISTLLYYIETLVITEFPINTKERLLSIIKQTVNNGGINFGDFSALCEKVNGIDLLSVFELITFQQDEKKNLIKNSTDHELSQ